MTNGIFPSKLSEEAFFFSFFWHFELRELEDQILLSKLHFLSKQLGEYQVVLVSSLRDRCLFFDDSSISQLIDRNYCKADDKSSKEMCFCRKKMFSFNVIAFVVIMALLSIVSSFQDKNSLDIKSALKNFDL